MKINQVVSIFGAITSMMLSTMAASAGGQTSLAHLHAGQPSSSPIGWVQFCAATPRECVAKPSQAETVTLTDARWREMVDVNLRFNKAIKPVTDHDQFGVVERWTYADTGSGDCEDYVLEKRRELASRGWPLAALLITVVIDKDGGGHAVLSVMTDKGEFILDNQTDAILPWSQSELIFIKRQSPANPNTWVDLGRAFGRPDAITASVSRSQTQRVR
jgi:predicted transglutaminase-like cysteine proteinase